jgi:hypothetical protein
VELSADALQRALETHERRIQAEKTEYEQTLKYAEIDIVNRQTVLNTNLPDGESLIIRLFKEHDIAVSHEIQNWIKNDLADIHYNERHKEWRYNYFIKSNDNSEFSDYLPMLVSAVHTKQQYDEMNDCPLGGDIENDCADCVYSGDYRFQDGECVERDDDETEDDMEI